MSSRGTTRRPGTGLLVAVVAALAVLAGCGEEPADERAEEESSASAGASTPAAEPSDASAASPSGEAEPDAESWPACGKVWVDGKRLPEEYVACSTGAGKVVEAQPLMCETGQVLVTHSDRFYGVLGGKVIRTKAPYTKDPRYQRAYRACTA